MPFALTLCRRVRTHPNLQASENDDLYGCRGGGGQLRVVTSFRFRTFPSIGDDVLVSVLQTRRVVGACNRWPRHTRRALLGSRSDGRGRPRCSRRVSLRLECALARLPGRSSSAARGFHRGATYLQAMLCGPLLDAPGLPPARRGLPATFQVDSCMRAPALRRGIRPAQWLDRRHSQDGSGGDPHSTRRDQPRPAAATASPSQHLVPAVRRVRAVRRPPRFVARSSERRLEPDLSARLRYYSIPTFPMEEAYTARTTVASDDQKRHTRQAFRSARASASPVETPKRAPASALSKSRPATCYPSAVVQDGAPLPAAPPSMPSRAASRPPCLTASASPRAPVCASDGVRGLPQADTITPGADSASRARPFVLPPSTEAVASRSGPARRSNSAAYSYGAPPALRLLLFGAPGCTGVRAQPPHNAAALYSGGRPSSREAATGPRFLSARSRGSLHRARPHGSTRPSRPDGRIRRSAPLEPRSALGVVGGRRPGAAFDRE